jgi:hypothetical protein
MRRRLLKAAIRSIAVAALGAICTTSALAAKSDKIEELVGLHDLKTAVAIGNYYLKQRALFAVRDELARIGVEQKLGPQWNPADLRWQQAQSAMMSATVKRMNRDFSSLEWLSEEWSQLNDQEFTEPDIDYLLSHFHTEYGRKQIMIVDHGVAVHVQSALTFTGKMQYDVPGLEQDRDVMQHLFNDEDRDMRFNIADSPEGTQFAMSTMGKRYFVNAMLKVSGMISRRLDQTADAMPQTVRDAAAQAQPAIQAFRRDHEG